jgi:hypothetical protein
LGDNRLAELDEEEDPEEGEQQYPGIEIGQEEGLDWEGEMAQIDSNFRYHGSKWS